MTLEQQNEIRARVGMAPLTELPAGVNAETENVNTNLNPDAAVSLNEAKATEGTVSDTVEKEITTQAPIVTTAAPAKVFSPKDLSTEELLAALKEKGVVIPEKQTETAEQLQAKREAAKMAWAYGNGHLSAKDHAAYNADSANLENLVYRQYLSDQKALDPTLTDSEILQEFNDKYGREADPNSRQYKSGERLIETMANNILKEKYKSVFSLDENYSKYESEANKRTERENTIKANTPKYKAAVEEIFSKDLASYTLKIGGEDYSFTFPQDQLNEVKNQYLDADTALPFIEQGKSKEEILLMAEMQLLKTSMAHLMENGMKQYLVKHQKGVKGVSTDITTTPAGTKVYTEGQKIAFSRNNRATQDN